jgi:glutaredoxin
MPDKPPEPILYTQAGCAESARVRRWLVAHGVSFSERDAGNDPAAAKALAATGTFATPLLVIGDNRVLSPQPRILTALLGGGEKPAALIDDGDAP